MRIGAEPAAGCEPRLYSRYRITGRASCHSNARPQSSNDTLEGSEQARDESQQRDLPQEKLFRHAHSLDRISETELPTELHVEVNTPFYAPFLPLQFWEDVTMGLAPFVGMILDLKITVSWQEVCHPSLPQGLQFSGNDLPGQFPQPAQSLGEVIAHSSSFVSSNYACGCLRDTHGGDPLSTHGRPSAHPSARQASGQLH